MYKYKKPTPLVIDLCDDWGFEMRQKAAEYIEEYENMTGAERGSAKQQSYGALAEIVVRNKLELPDLNPEDHPADYDLELPSKVKVDVKCRGGEKPFQEEYEGSDGLPREAKHNLFARQVYDEDLGTDIYLMTHLEVAGDGELPGTTRQRKWKLYICGWVSKERAKKNGVYLPPKSLSERGFSWFPYRFHEIEFYNKNLNGLADIEDLQTIEPKDVKADEETQDDLNLTRVDATRIAYDLIGRGVLKPDILEFLGKELDIEPEKIKSFLHVNQYNHLVKWLKEEGKITDKEFKAFSEFYNEQRFEGLGRKSE